ncbi:MAG TPA: hypothetical protein PLB67_07260 [Candidatus Hydrogenedentes bacterium]|nr:hypothetical protein [Candidatus Hydrogenedentota bacterium]
MGCVQRRPVRVVLGIVMSLAVAYPALGAGEGPAAGAAAPPPREMNGLNLLHFEDFEKDPGVIAKQWKPTDPKAWAVVEDGAGHAYALKGASDYTPPVRSPHNVSLLNDLEVTDFVLQADMKQTGKEYGHRDMCIFFGYQDPAHFYYVHIATRADPHAHSVFIVNGAPRVSIAAERTEGADWGLDVYHKVRIARDTASGAIKVFFDNLDTPIMTAQDKTFLHGKVGFGSFDDTGNVDNIVLWGKKKE